MGFQLSQVAEMWRRKALENLQPLILHPEVSLNPKLSFIKAFCGGAACKDLHNCSKPHIPGPSEPLKHGKILCRGYKIYTYI